MARQQIIILPRPRPETVYETHEHIERRAPTDESVRLLREMEAAARGEVLDSISVGDTNFACVVHAARDPMTSETMLAAVFSVGGDKQKVDVRVAEGSTPREMFDALTKAVAERLAERIVLPAMLPLLQGRRLG